MKTPRLSLALLLVALMPAPARGEPEGVLAAPPVDMVVASVTLRDADTGETGPFAAGAGIDVTVTLRNDGRDVVSLRRIALRAAPALTVSDPASDAIDNDGDGETDEEDEAFRQRNGEGDVWRFAGDGLALGPGDTVTRALRVGIAETARPGTVATLALSAGTTLSESARSRPQKTLHEIGIALASPALTIASDAGEAISTLSEPVMTGDVVLPGAVLEDARVSVAFPPAMTGASVESYRVGPAIDCAEDPAPTVEDGRALLHLGRCRIDGTRPPPDRAVRLAVSLTPRDAAPGIAGEALAAWRAIAVTLEASDGGAALGKKTLDMTLRGPRPVTGLTLPRGRRYRTGDPVVARLSVANEGDLPLAGSEIGIVNDEAFACVSAVFGEDGETRDCEGTGLALPPVAIGETLDIALTLRLREDALFEAGDGPELVLTGDAVAAHPFPVRPLAMALHEAPFLEIADDGDLTAGDTGPTATIGDAARLRVGGTLPPGRYRGEVRLMARIIASQTGIPLSPATLTVADPVLEITDAKGKTVEAQPGFSTREGPIWAEYVLAFDLRNDGAGAGENRAFTAEFDIRLADDPRLEAERVLEITAETDAYGDNTMVGASWIAILVREPDLRLKLLSPDDDRIVEPDERFGVVSLACNYGDSPAHGTVLTLDTSPRIDLLSKETRAQVFTVPLDAARDGQFDEIDAQRAALDGIEARVYERSVALVPGDVPLAPETCIGIELTAPLTEDPDDSDATASVLASLDAYASAADAGRARRYPAARGEPMRFTVQSVRLGPSTTIQLGNEASIAHPVELSVPEGLGPFSVSFETLSSTGLDWSLYTPGGGGDPMLWTGSRSYPAGATVAVEMRTETPAHPPLGWVDTSRLRAAILTASGKELGASLRLVIRTGTGSARAIGTDKRVALDRDCDGELADERAQDALFEAGKDATPGDCFVVRIGFENTGTREVEKIVIRDAVSSRTTLLPGSVSVRIAPEPLDRVVLPATEAAGDGEALEGGILEWEFMGLFRPGAVGEVEYRLRLE